MAFSSPLHDVSQLSLTDNHAYFSKMSQWAKSSSVALPLLTPPSSY